MSFLFSPSCGRRRVWFSTICCLLLIAWLCFLSSWTTSQQQPRTPTRDRDKTQPAAGPHRRLGRDRMIDFLIWAARSPLARFVSLCLPSSRLAAWPPGFYHLAITHRGPATRADGVWNLLCSALLSFFLAAALCRFGLSVFRSSGSACCIKLSTLSCPERRPFSFLSSPFNLFPSSFPRSVLSLALPFPARRLCFFLSFSLSLTVASLLFPPFWGFAICFSFPLLLFFLSLLHSSRWKCILADQTRLQSRPLLACSLLSFSVLFSFPFRTKRHSTRSCVRSCSSSRCMGELL